ncbi:MAG TPA: asparagine synthase (glutamine-hydrolyzing), partial [Candidatus Eisenbacteria bacterium]|nr:asparagine synthase (glutamine-hydrolyzing) [Candidatus Eisenbacteria bacterium]
MCGICGKLNFDRDERIDPDLIQSMMDAIQHRGPDDQGTFLRGQVALGHCRLSIIDLNTGHQPLSNEDGSVWIVFNGEIYNYRELRAFLLSKGHAFRTQTDTEVIVHLYEELGPGCLDKLRGMFAFAIWDERARSLFLARDRVGIKPVYYCQTDHSLVFASEIKAILADPAVERQIAPDMIDRFLTFFYLPGEETLLKNVSKLAPGHYLLLKNGKPEIRQYWDLSFSKPAARPSRKHAEAQLVELLSETVERHMIADVPVGVLLSGGVDSTAVLSFAVENTNKSVSSYTVGFSEDGVADERSYARLAARTFATQHHDMTITAADFSSFMPAYVWHMEEPVCEPPAIALYYVSKLAKSHVKVLLSGEGGDEAFAGYSNYRNLLWLERIKHRLSSLRGAAAWGLSFADSMVQSRRMTAYVPLVSADFPDYYYSRTSNPFRSRQNGLGKLYSEDFARSIDREAAVEPVRRLHAHVRNQNTLDAMLYIDAKSWLPDDLLLKADKMTMANSLELRVPLLDHKVLEFAAALPTELKVRGFTTKYLAKKALRSRVPRAILDRPKAGFPVPYESWLRKELSGWVREILLDRVTTNRGYFVTSAVQDLLARSEAKGGYSKEIFSLVALELWHRAFMADVKPAHRGSRSSHV